MTVVDRSYGCTRLVDRCRDLPKVPNGQRQQTTSDLSVHPEITLPVVILEFSNKHVKEVPCLRRIPGGRMNETPPFVEGSKSAIAAAEIYLNINLTMEVASRYA